MTVTSIVMAATQKIRRRRWPFFFLLLVALWVLPPTFLSSPYYLRLVSFGWINAIIALGLNMAVGVAGQINLGQAAFVGLSAYVTAMLIKLVGWTWLPSAVAGIVGTVVAGTAVGWVSNRLRGPYLAIVTLGFNLVFQILLLTQVDFTGGPMGLRVKAPEIFGVKMNMQAIYIVLFGFFILIYMLCRLIYYSKIGRNFRATRDDEIVARIMGVNTVRAKVQACMFSAFCAGVAGVLFLLNYLFIAPAAFTPMQSFRYLAMVVIGGLGNLLGSVLGALVITFIPEFLRVWPGLWDVVLGGSILLVLLLFPKGLGFFGEYLSTLFSQKKIEQRWTGQIRSPGGEQ